MTRPKIRHSLINLSPCIPSIEICDNQWPKGGKFRLYFEFEFMNSGTTDIYTEIVF